ncbi:MAG TPA: aspartate aminotransferase family protein [Methylomirabilota bacterium]|nr:aspartate aminotransferase family protein [Methylomirabilota bacterium]
MSLDKELVEYAAKTARSRALHEEALAVMPGGNSRSTTFFDPYPFYFSRGQGAHIWDVDGTERIDFNGNYTSLVVGHAHADVVKAVQGVAESGLSFPGPTEHEVRLAEALSRRLPSMESLRFTNSGTEATMNAVRLARAFTGRTKIAKFEGAYHGTHDWVMVSVTPDPKAAGNRRRPKPVAWSAGIPPAVLKHVVVLPWNDQEACAEILAKEGEQIAGLIVDPILCNAGLISPAAGFLPWLREETERRGIVLIFDEVISFRVAWGGAQERFGIRPDLTTLGKIIGGGLPVGAFGGRRDIMAFYDPRKHGARISHGGTFNANPVTMAAGLATLNALTPEAYARLDALGERLRGGVSRLFSATRRKGQISGVGSLFWLHWTTEKLTDYRSARPKDGEAAERVFLGMINEGILMTQRGLGACSLAMSDEDVDRFVNAMARVLARA